MLTHPTPTPIPPQRQPPQEAEEGRRVVSTGGGGGGGREGRLPGCGGGGFGCRGRGGDEVELFLKGRVCEGFWGLVRDDRSSDIYK